MRHSPQPSPSPSFARPGEVRAEDDAGAAAWLARLVEPTLGGGPRDAACAGFALAPAGAGFWPVA